jgi:hypothetical protein
MSTRLNDLACYKFLRQARSLEIGRAKATACPLATTVKDNSMAAKNEEHSYALAARIARPFIYSGLQQFAASRLVAETSMRRWCAGWPPKTAAVGRQGVLASAASLTQTLTRFSCCSIRVSWPLVDVCDADFS